MNRDADATNASSQSITNDELHRDMVPLKLPSNALQQGLRMAKHREHETDIKTAAQESLKMGVRAAVVGLMESMPVVGHAVHTAEKVVETLEQVEMKKGINTAKAMVESLAETTGTVLDRHERTHRNQADEGLRIDMKISYLDNRTTYLDNRVAKHGHQIARTSVLDELQDAALANHQERLASVEERGRLDGNRIGVLEDTASRWEKEIPMMHAKIERLEENTGDSMVNRVNKQTNRLNDHDAQLESIVRDTDSRFRQQQRQFGRLFASMADQEYGSRAIVDFIDGKEMRSSDVDALRRLAKRADQRDEDREAYGNRIAAADRPDSYLVPMVRNERVESKSQFQSPIPPTTEPFLLTHNAENPKEIVVGPNPST